MNNTINTQNRFADLKFPTVDVEGTGAAVASSIKAALKVLTGTTTDGAGGTQGAVKLEAPKKLTMDASMLMAELQDVLNQLMQKLSVLDIKQNLQTQNDAGKKQLEEIKKSVEDAKAAAAKEKEAEKKGNIFEAISHAVMTVVAAVSAVISVVSAIGQFFTGNMVAAAALIVAAAALTVQACCEFVLMVDSASKAAGAGGIGIDAELCAKVGEYAGYVALGAGMIGMVGGLTAALSDGAKAALKEGVGATAKYAAKAAVESVKTAGKELMEAGAAKLASVSAKFGTGGVAKEVAKEAAEEVAEKTIKEIMEETSKEIAKSISKSMQAMKQAPTTQYIKDITKTVMVGQAANQSVKLGGQLAKTELTEDAIELRRSAGTHEEAAEGLKAMITKLQAMLEQLQAQMESDMDAGQDLMSALLQPITDRMKTLSTLTEGIGRQA